MSQKVPLVCAGERLASTGQGGDPETTSAVGSRELREILMLKMEAANCVASLIPSGHSF